MDPQKTINDVVNSVKAEGLFDQFRKECLEEFDKMETYNQLKQTVENHVASFLSKHRFNQKLQKNSLRTDLRNHLNKSEVLLNGIQRLVDEVLSLKGHGFCLKIDKQVDKFLNPEPEIKEEKHTDSNLPESNTLIPEDNEGVKNEIVNEVTEIEEVEMDIESNHSESNFSPKAMETANNENDGQINRLSEEVSTNDKESMHVREPKDLFSHTPESSSSDESPQNSLSKDNSPHQSVSETEMLKEDKTHDKKSDNEKLDDKTDKDIMIGETLKNESQLQNTTTEKIQISRFDESHTEEVDSVKNDDNFCRNIEEQIEHKFHQETTVETPTSYFNSLQTEPISDESTSNSNDSFEQISDASDNDQEAERISDHVVENISDHELDINLRKSHRKRSIPLKYRDDEENIETKPQDNENESSKNSKGSSRNKTQKKPLSRNSSVESTSSSRGRPSKRSRTVELDTNSKQKRSASKDDKSSRKSTTKRETESRSSKITCPEERSSKRPRRPTKQRDRYSPD